MPTEKQIETAARAMHDGPLGADDHDFDAPENASQRQWCLDMARAALESAQPRVKRLEWAEDRSTGFVPGRPAPIPGLPDEPARLLAITWFARANPFSFDYLITQLQRDGENPFILSCGLGEERFGSLDAAKAAAQADYEARILSALTTEGE